MKRLELFEFEDFQWLPNFIRSGVTRLIMVLHRMMGTSDVIARILNQTQKNCAFDRVVDMGAGSGGPMIDIFNNLEKHNLSPSLQLILTDLYPNPKTIDSIKKKEYSNITYSDQPLNAKDLSKAPKGLKTMIASFHHMSPNTAQEILHSAEKNHQPILIYEIAANTIPVLVWWILLPISLLILIIMTLVMTPFVRPLTWKQLIFTYLIPVIPIVYAWDGQASIMRTYTFDDIKSLLGAPKSPHYQWKIEEAKKENGKTAGYYILGYPVFDKQ